MEKIFIVKAILRKKYFYSLKEQSSSPNEFKIILKINNKKFTLLPKSNSLANAKP